MQEALARQRAGGAAVSNHQTNDPVQRSSSPWDSAWDQQSAAVQGQSQGLTSHERLLSGLATARQREHSSGVFGSIVEDPRTAQYCSGSRPSYLASNRTRS